jgi:uncharacterized protein (DUF1800 family)
LNEMNADGTLKWVGGLPVPTYSKADVEGLAKVFTGWGWNYPANDYFWDTTNTGFVFPEVQSRQMMAVPDFHSTSEKNFLGVTVAAQATPNPRASLDAALNRLSTHPNVAPFIGRRLIQNLVTSNPSPAYIGRVSAAFTASGGNMGAMVRAVLLDAEARDAAQALNPQYGRLREPLMRLTHFAHALQLKSVSGTYGVGYRITPGDLDAATTTGQMPLDAPSVFNWFRPGYVPPSSSIAAANLVAPEFQIFDEVMVKAWIDSIEVAAEQGFGGSCCNLFYNRDITSDYVPEVKCRLRCVPMSRPVCARSTCPPATPLTPSAGACSWRCC